MKILEILESIKKSVPADVVINRYVNWVSQVTGIGKPEVREKFISKARVGSHGRDWLSFRPVSEKILKELFPRRSTAEGFNLDAFEKKVFGGTGWTVNSYHGGVQEIIISPYVSVPKPEYLYHGTLKENLPAIMKRGLKPGTRNTLIRYRDRLFLFTEFKRYEMMNLLTAIHGTHKENEIVFLKIDTNKFDKFNIYKDTDADAFDAVFTPSHIPPHALEIIDEA